MNLAELWKGNKKKKKKKKNGEVGWFFRGTGCKII